VGWGLGFGIKGLGYRVKGWGLGLGLGFGTKGLGCRVKGWRYIWQHTTPLRAM